jgi:hypothetical protein
MQNTASSLLASVKPKTASGVVKIVTVSHWGFAANDPNVYQGCSDCSYDVASDRLFMSEDPVGYKDGYNLYAYAHNNPLKYYDPMGTTAMTHTERMQQQAARWQGVTTPYSRAMAGASGRGTSYDTGRTTRGSRYQAIGELSFGTSIIFGGGWAYAASLGVAVPAVIPIIVVGAAVVGVWAYSYDAYR